MKTLQAEVNLFLIALGFLSRIPVPANLDFSQTKLNDACRYFALVGYVLGGLCAFSYWGLSQLFDSQVAVILSIGVSLLLTGCFHEDGLADTCDGFGGGWSKEQKLTIMKDSRIGTYGAAGLWFILTAKLIFLVHLDNITSALLLAYPLSRSVSVCVMFLAPYVTDIDASKVKPIAMASSRKNLLVNIIIGASCLLIIPQIAGLMALVLLSALMLYVVFIKRQIGGFTGDTLGAAQQFFELLIYLVLLYGAL